ncbi:Cbb3-type cytochrome c oxidase subunit CcoP2 [Zhongshania aliphaticivorans]|uniref:Cbb3-type cytochrome c oxidase subunit n=1 Tax=Zhongshania aliphaticivorans TaxID=1470434 RepID=A0A5S9NIT4_9GAMM|nr:cytochrome-c oxidase, cbb3-type subunit III [Zhongshania aliphaticivorans]CAA0090510.1 Cbb3-type cytochrome c oxidase subunit CcoP2 [Zhongshania aliphaticivorans]CAA0097973.1 Cbb3-type cytochrome c oxidase subunit CcoP2 [Zhongshania aliphaticivorans]
MSSFWSMWIIVLTVISIALIVWLLFSNRKITASKENQTTGHIYDGIEEYDNPLPSWWFKMFVISIVFAIGYLIAFPGLGNFPGLLNWTSVGKWEKEVARAEQANDALYAGFMTTDTQTLAANKKAMRIGKRIFANNCAICHGVNGEGSYGFPNLTDQDWLYGGTPELIQTSISQGRNGAMPAWNAMFDNDGLEAMAQYVKNLASTDLDTDSPAGKKFAMLCASCHGAEGQGNQAMGAPNLADNIWLYGGDAGQIKHSIASGRGGQMPAHHDKLSAEKIHLLTAYVYQLSQQQ